jgi:AcrR family transcriptional regulator
MKVDLSGTLPHPPPSERVRRTRLRILQAAAQQFSAQGYSGATTRAIAAAAGVSELTLFRHFGSKKALFLAMMAENSPLPGLRAGLSAQASGDLRPDLVGIGLNFLSAIQARRREILMTLREAEAMPELRPMIVQAPLQQRRILAAYLERQAAQGHLRLPDPSLAAQALLGMLFAYAIQLPLLEDQPEANASLEHVVSSFVDIFLRGVELPGGDAPAK